LDEEAEEIELKVKREREIESKSRRKYGDLGQHVEWLLGP
jgi:hypothetical protein